MSAKELNVIRYDNMKICHNLSIEPYSNTIDMNIYVNQLVRVITALLSVAAANTIVFKLMYSSVLNLALNAESKTYCFSVGVHPFPQAV